jgi:Ca-activated chloride channel family protein
MKNRILLFVIMLTLFLSSCTYTGPNPSNSTTSSEGSMQGVEQAVITFDIPGEVSLARNFYFLFDCSGSMDGACSNKRKIEGAKEAMLRFLKNVPTDANIGLLGFGLETSNGCREILPLGKNDYASLESAISPLEPTGDTPLGEAISIGTEKLVEQYKKQLGYGEYRLVVITDGEANDTREMVNACKNLSRFGFVSLYSIGLCMDRGNPLKDFSLSSRDASNYDELEEALIETAAETDVFDASVFDSTLFQK